MGRDRMAIRWHSELNSVPGPFLVYNYDSVLEGPALGFDPVALIRTACMKAAVCYCNVTKSAGQWA